MTQHTKELLVGSLVIHVIVLIIIFAWLMGVVSPFHRDIRFDVLYGFAGGIEVGSPVRVSGVKVGKVEKIEFLPEPKDTDGDVATIKLVVSVSPRAAVAVRKNSKFFVNMAGIIGERYLEISPGSNGEPILVPGSTVRGIDPPRIDQLLSQGYGVFGRIEEFMEKNEESVTEFLTNIGSLLNDANKFLKTSDRKKLYTLVDNMVDITTELRSVAKGLNDPKTRETFRQLHDLVNRAHDVDQPALKKFFQEEGIRTRIF